VKLHLFLVIRHLNVFATMVKFAIAPAFLIIASLSTSVSATFALSNITIFPTGYSVLSDGTENPGDDVSTVPASKGTPNTTVRALIDIVLFHG
jgi:hypothetical protein